MTLSLQDAQSIRGLVDLERGLVDRRIFAEDDIYQLEMEQIFARAWNFMCHDSQIPNPGDFFMTFIGEDRVICVRDNDGNPQVLINSCRHRGNAVCRAEEGHATSFMCTYHGWTYDLKGALVGVPGFKEVYHEELDRENWGLITAAQVDTYKGLIFACMDADAPGLVDYLGETGRMCIDALGDQGDMEVLPGLTKYTIKANWKICTDNTWDYYHGQVSHASVRFVDPYGDQPRDQDGKLDRKKQFSYRADGTTVYLSDYGHVAAGGSGSRRESLRRRFGDPKVMEKTVQTGNRLIFPNLFMIGNQMEIRHPKGPGVTEVWMFALADRNESPEVRENARFRALHSFAPAGFHEQDDGENWDQSTRGASGVISQRFPLNYQMGVGHGEVVTDETGPSHILTGISEHPQMWMYYSWANMMAARSWADLKANPARPPARM